ncbi:SusC/RagA family TonB-linked outer membrane protein [Cyclobacterium marinum]|uniref:TonB-dependent receptor plug n=1 Tax=Cyclobacterium marinum (strain ATCC 25205 / DSM 745 / LMG 13164 / NCIMB 1802) TaxID=880070 RepID=G0IV88_CYCMS|nr:TonB-dependent receptor [Cyclobacterium marinum]AEL27887.1 TonB-dependent receptor plug [Cyclobacterium marinum DSM 745]MBR9777123.1 TonB-dependent receptor [Cytophagales bacterium]
MQKLSLKLGYLILLIGLNTQLLMAQNVEISGRIVDENNMGIPGASVLIKGTSTGAAADVEGNYNLSAPSNATLVFSFIGYSSKEVKIENQTIVNVQLEPDISDLDEVIVVGYGTTKKSQLTGAISSVGNKEILELPITDARQALQGRATGVDVTQAGSKPGAEPQVRIRGRRSFNAGNDPLYVVDNIPIVGGMTDFNPQDIASMEVLKDASATAIYGSRGANGVVIITTKRGNAGKTRVSVDSYYGISKSLGRIQNFNGEEFAEYKRESRRAVGEYPEGPATPEADASLFEPNELESIELGRSFDYIDALTRTGSIQNHNVSVGGGNEKTTFFISANFFKDIGVVKLQDFTRHTYRINLDHKFNDKFRIGTSTLATYSERNGANFNPIGGALQENPLGKTFNDDGTINFKPTQDGLRTNPLAEIVPGAHEDLTKRYRIFNSFYAVYDITPSLTYRFNFGPDIGISRSGRFIGSQTNARREGDPTGSISEEFQFNYTIENIINYTKILNESHTFQFTGLQSLQRDNREYSSINVLGIPAESQSYHQLGDASQITGANTNLIQWTLLSFMGRLNYDYQGKYLMTATLRADGSSRFGKNNRFGYFPSVALGWNIGDERFLQESTVLDQLKLRISYGAIGNQGIAPYQTQPLLARTSYEFGSNAAFGYLPNTIGNPDLKWETSTTANAGLDFVFSQGRIAGSAEYYITTTTDLLAPQPLPNSTGFGGFITNIGKTQNRGIELTLNTINIDKGNFRWSTDFIFNRNREEILELADGDDVGAGRFIGEPLTVFYDWNKIGIWQVDEADEAAVYSDQPGIIKIEDVNNDGQINADDRQILGSPVPDFAGGITNRFSYKGLDLSFFIFGRFGSMIRSGFHTGGFNALAGRYNNLNVDYWTPDNPTNDYPRPNVNQEFPKYSSSLQYFDGTFLKIRNINFGYTMPEGIVERLKMESLRVYTSIQQPFIFSKYRSRHAGIDPETFIDGEQGVEGGVINSNIAPAVTQFTFGINAKF